MSALLEAIDLTKQYSMAGQTVHALRGISLAIDAGDYVIGTGRYRGTHKTTGKSLSAQFCHVMHVDQQGFTSSGDRRTQLVDQPRALVVYRQRDRSTRVASPLMPHIIIV
mgnify:CR=1 FL=1